MTSLLLDLWRGYLREYKARVKAGHENEAMDFLGEYIRKPAPKLFKNLFGSGR